MYVSSFFVRYVSSLIASNLNSVLYPVFILTIPSFILSLRPHWQNQALIFTIISSLLSITTIIVDVGLFLDLRYQFGRTRGLKSGGKTVYGPGELPVSVISVCLYWYYSGIYERFDIVLCYICGCDYVS